MMTSRITIVTIAIALASATACKSKDQGKDKGDDGKGSGTAKTSGPKPTSSKAPPGKLAVSSQAVALEREANVFVALDAHGALALGVVPRDREAGAWVSVPVPDVRELGDRHRSLHEGQRALEDEDALVQRLTAPPLPRDEALMGELTPREDDPPPPELAEEGWAGGSGTTIALDEGWMGNKRQPDEPGMRPAEANDAQYGGDGVDGAAAAIAPVDERLAVPGMVQPGAIAAPTTVIVADVAADARRLFEILDKLSQAAIAVRGADGKVARSPVRFNVESTRTSYAAMTERLVDLSPAGVIVRSGPGDVHGNLTWQGDQLDAAGLATAWAAAIDARPERKDVEVSIADGVSVAQLVSVLDALAAAGAQEITLRNWTRPELHGPYMKLGGLQKVGNLEREVILDAIEPQLGALRGCYADAVTKDPALAGLVRATFLISPKGKVESSKAEGVSKPVAACIAKVIQPLELPAPSGGGPVNVQLGISFTNLP